MASAFSYTATSQIKENIRTLFRRVKNVSKMPVTHDEFASLFIPAEHRAMYRAVAQVARTGEGYASFKWGSSKLIFRLCGFGEKHPLPVPRDMILQGDAPPELVERISTWMVSGGDASGDFGRVTALFNKLDGSLTKGQIRCVWPSVLAILAASPTLDETLKGLQEAKVPSKAPELPRGLLAACRKTAASIATASLIPHDVHPMEPGEGLIETADRQKYDELGLGEFYGID